MTVSSSTAKAGPYAGAGLPGPFTVPFRFLAASHLQVIKTSTAGIDAVLTLTTDYTVAGVGAASGSVTLTAPLASGERLTIVRDVPFTQLADYVNNDAFPAESHEDALDLLTMQTQQLKERVDSALTLPPTVTGASGELPSPEPNKLIGWNEAGNALQNMDATTLATIVAFGTSRADTFTGNGTQTQFALTANPGALANLDVAIGGVTQTPGVNFTFSGTTLTFAVAPPLGVVILARYFLALPQGVTDSAASTFIQSGVGAVQRNVQDKLREIRSRADYPSWGSRSFGAGTNVLGGAGFVGVENIAFGGDILNVNTTGFANVGVGLDILSANTTGAYNYGFGIKCLLRNTIGISNSAFGTFTLYNNTTGNSNVAMGEDGQRYADTGSFNVTVGVQALYNNGTGSNNTAVGTYAARGFNNPGDEDPALGPSPTQLCAFGLSAVYSAAGTHNSGFGVETLYNVTGSFNTAVGGLAGRRITSGANNVFVGYNAGNNASQYVAATDCVVLGRDAYTTGDNAVVIGAGVAAGANQIAIGNPSHIGVFLFGNINPQTDNSQDIGGAAARWRSVFANRVVLTPTVVASLPIASAGLTGARAFVTNATATTFASIVAGGGSNAVPVYCDGANWRIG